MLEINTIHLGNCLELMKDIESNTIDLIITSPPYNIGKKYSQYSDNRDDYIQWLSSVVSICSTKLRDNGAMFLNVGYRKLDKGNVPITYDLYPHIDMYLNQEIVWEYGAGMTYKSRFNHRSERWMWLLKNSRAYQFYPDAVRDPSLTKYKNDKRNNPMGKLPGDVWYFPHVSGTFEEREKHPAQYPIDMIQRIILGCSKEGDTICDPFVGSGTTAIACLNTNRNYICIELDPNYHKISTDRVEKWYSNRRELIKQSIVSKRQKENESNSS